MTLDFRINGQHLSLLGNPFVVAEKKEHDSVKAENADLKGKKDKQDKLAKVVKALTKAEYDSLPKELQKELKEYR